MGTLSFAKVFVVVRTGFVSLLYEVKTIVKVPLIWTFTVTLLPNPNIRFDSDLVT